ncbi:MAG: acylneuraminate cytidylyltransferase family protein, partial [Sulfurimonas sp.]
SSYDYVVLLQPTSPLRQAHHIDAAIEQLHRHGADAVVSVCEMEHSPLWSNTLPENESMEGFLDAALCHRRAQDLPTYYRLNGAIYICKIERLLQEKRVIIPNNIVAFKMSREASVDIDDALDFEFAAYLLQRSAGT